MMMLGGTRFADIPLMGLEYRFIGNEKPNDQFVRRFLLTPCSLVSLCAVAFHPKFGDREIFGTVWKMTKTRLTFCRDPSTPRSALSKCPCSQRRQGSTLYCTLLHHGEGR